MAPAPARVVLMCFKREKRFGVTKSGLHKNVANADSSWFQEAAPALQLQAPVEMGTSLKGLRLGGTESKIIPIMSPPEEPGKPVFSSLLASKTWALSRASGRQGLQGQEQGVCCQS